MFKRAENFMRELKNSRNVSKALIAIILGLFITWLFKGIITPILFSEKSFEGRSASFQLLLILVFVFFFTTICFLLISLIERLCPRLLYRIHQKVNLWSNSVANDPQTRIFLGLTILTIGFLTIFIVNNVISHINTKTWQYETQEIIPVMQPLGNDFRVGLYWPASNLVKSNFTSIGPNGKYISIYPPLVSLISLFYLLLPENNAYLFHINLLILTNIACLFIATMIAKKFLLLNQMLEKSQVTAISFYIFFVVAIYTFSGYSFAFSFERGNVDIIAMFFSLLAIWFLLEKPDKIWLQVILLSIAVHFKIYPAALFAILFFKHGKKMIFPTISVNIALLLVLGPKFALGFINALTSGSGDGGGIGNRWTWIGNHSAYSFSESLLRSYPDLPPYSFFILWGIFLLLPTLFWALAYLKIVRKMYTPQNAVMLLMVTIPFMESFPTISMDYRLVILSSATVLLIAYILKQTIQSHDWLDFFQLGILIIILLFIGRPYTMSKHNPYILEETASFFLNNKYLWCLALEALIALNVFKNKTSIQTKESIYA